MSCFLIKLKIIRLRLLISFMWSIFPKNLLANICLKAINSNSCSHIFVPDKMLQLENERKRLNYNESLNCMPFGNFFLFLCHLGSYLFCIHFLSELRSKLVDETTKLTSVVPLILGLICTFFLVCPPDYPRLVRVRPSVMFFCGPVN